MFGECVKGEGVGREWGGSGEGVGREWGGSGEGVGRCGRVQGAKKECNLYIKLRFCVCLKWSSWLVSTFLGVCIYEIR